MIIGLLARVCEVLILKNVFLFSTLLSYYFYAFPEDRFRVSAFINLNPMIESIRIKNVILCFTI